MVQVDFHTGLTDKLGHACRLLRKAYRAGHRVVVTGAPEQLARLDSQLWTFDVGEFIPHARLRQGQPVPPRLAATPVWLADVPADAGVDDVLVNLGPGPVDGLAQFQRVIELVADDADDVAEGRQRWRQYVAAGITPTQHKAG
ncbi:MAG: DNA polymerase III subunit chi [Burkholderiales bacterium PBB5]|nr:MAG: DNA polymerase III subunit chi [Burkholderiales bacterium PBB5]